MGSTTRPCSLRTHAASQPPRCALFSRLLTSPPIAFVTPSACAHHALPPPGSPLCARANLACHAQPSWLPRTERARVRRCHLVAGGARPLQHTPARKPGRARRASERPPQPSRASSGAGEGCDRRYCKPVGVPAPGVGEPKLHERNLLPRHGEMGARGLGSAPPSPPIAPTPLPSVLTGGARSATPPHYSGLYVMPSLHPGHRNGNGRFYSRRACARRAACATRAVREGRRGWAPEGAAGVGR